MIWEPNVSPPHLWEAEEQGFELIFKNPRKVPTQQIYHLY